jgi:hypothetical protein
VLKTLFFAGAVALIPVAAFLRAAQAAAPSRPAPRAPAGALRPAPELQSLVRLFAAILLIEAVSLISNYH